MYACGCNAFCDDQWPTCVLCPQKGQSDLKPDLLQRTLEFGCRLSVVETEGSYRPRIKKELV